MEEQLRQRITINPRVMVGKPVIRGTRIPVELIVRMMAQGISESDILREYPRLQPDDIRGIVTEDRGPRTDEEKIPTADRRPPTVDSLLPTADR